MSVHQMRVDSVDYTSRAAVFVCDDCGHRIRTCGPTITILKEGDHSVQHSGHVGVRIAGTEVVTPDDK